MDRTDTEVTSASDSPDHRQRDDGTRLPYRHLMLALGTVAGFVFLAGRIIIPPLAVPIKEAVSIGNAEFGLALTVLWGAYALMQFPSGTASDDLGHRTLLVGSMIVLSAGFLLFAVVGSFSTFLFAAIVIGIGGGSFMIVRFRFLSMLYRDNKGWAFGIAGGLTNLAGVVAPAAITVAIATVSWRLAFVVVGLSTLAMAVSFHVGIDETYSFRPPSIRRAVLSSFEQITSVHIVLLMVVTMAYSTVVQSVTSFIPLYMFEAKGMSFERSGLMLSLYFLVGVFVRPIAGWGSDILSRRWTAASALVVGGIMLGGLVFLADSFVWIVVSFALFSVAFLSFSPAMDAYFMDLFDDSRMGGAFGLSRTFILFVGSTGPALVGVGTETIGYTSTFALLAASIVIAGGLLVVLPWVAPSP